MVKLNLVNMNTLFRKVYFLAGVVMAANMFIVNEVRASNPQVGIKSDTTELNSPYTNPKLKLINENEKGKINTGAQEKPDVPGTNILDRLLSHENIINLIGEAVFSGFNNYLKWWDYNPGWYGQFVWFGWRSKRFLNDMLQFEVNLNVVRGILWLIPGSYNFIKGIRCDKDQDMENYFKPLYVSNLASCCFEDGPIQIIALIGVFLIQGFASIPLTLHFSNFSISISLDSMIWGVIGLFLDKKDEEEKGGEERKNNGPNMSENHNKNNLEQFIIKNKPEENSGGDTGNGDTGNNV